MAYKCPRCGESVQRGYSASAQNTAGLVGALFYAAFGAFECGECGKIARSEFPPQDRTRMMFGSVLFVFFALAAFAIAVWAITMLERRRSG